VSGFSRPTLDYFVVHAIDPDLAAMVGVTEADGRIVWPCRDASGQELPRRRRLDPEPGVGPKVTQPAGRTPAPWWPLGRPERASAVLVCEGEPDALAAASALRTAPEALRLAVVGLPGSSARLALLAGDLVACECKEVMLAAHGDPAGDRLAERITEELRPLDIAAVRLSLGEGRDLADELAGVSSDRGEWLAGRIADTEAAADEVAATAPSAVPALRFSSPAELRASMPPEASWTWDGYITPGAITLLAGKPKVGKSTLICALVEAIVTRAETFLSRRVVGGPVIYVSEEAVGTLLPKLPDHEDLRVLTREAAWPKPSWPKLIADAVEEARRIGAVLLVVDTWSYWSNLAPEREKDAGAAQQAIGVLVEATRAGLAVLLVHHQRKERGEDGDAIRGSGAIAGAVDVIVEYERPNGESPQQQRHLISVGRWPQTPSLLLVEHDVATKAWGHVAEGAGREDAAHLGLRQQLLQMLPCEEPGVTLGDLSALGKREVWHNELKRLMDEGAVRRTGGGRRGDPYRHCRAPIDSVPGFRSRAGTEWCAGGSDEVPSMPFPPVGGRQKESDSHCNCAANPRNGNGDAAPTAAVEHSKRTLTGDEFVERLIAEFDAADESARTRRALTCPYLAHGGCEWRHAGGVWTCGVCHPPAVDEVVWAADGDAFPEGGAHDRGTAA